MLTERVRRLLDRGAGAFPDSRADVHEQGGKRNEGASDRSRQRKPEGLHRHDAQFLSREMPPSAASRWASRGFHVFEQHKDRKEILIQAVKQDPLLDELASELDSEGRRPQA